MNAAVKRFIGCIMEYALLEDGSLSMMIHSVRSEGDDVAPVYLYTRAMLRRVRKDDFIRWYEPFEAKRAELARWLDESGVVFSTGEEATPEELSRAYLDSLPEARRRAEMRKDRLLKSNWVYLTKLNPDRFAETLECVLAHSYMSPEYAERILERQPTDLRIRFDGMAAFLREMRALGGSVLLPLNGGHYPDDAHFFDPLGDTFYSKPYGGTLNPIDQRDMHACYYIIDPATMCVFGSGSFVHATAIFRRENSGYPEFEWDGLRKWDFYHTLVKFSPHVDYDWYTYDIEIIERPSARFMEFLPDGCGSAALPDMAEVTGLPTTNRAPKPAKPVPVCTPKPAPKTGGISDPPPALKEREMVQFPGFELKNSDTRVFTVRQCTDEALVDALMALWRKLPARTGNGKLFVLELDGGAKHDLNAIRREIRTHCPGMKLAFRREVCMLHEGEPPMEAGDYPRLCWQDPQDGACYVAFERWEGYSHDGSGDYYSVLTRMISRGEFDALRRKGRNR